MERVVFCDESGHTGADLLSRTDPLLAFAMISLPAGDARDILTDLGTLRSQHRLFDLVLQWTRTPSMQAGLEEFGFKGPLDLIVSYRRASESSEPGIVLADVAAGTLRTVATTRLGGVDVAAEIRKIWEPLHRCILRTRGHCHVEMSKPLWGMFLFSG